MSGVPTQDWTWLNDAIDRFERAWRAGSRPRIEDALIDAEEPRRARLLEELLRVERELRQDGGEEPTREDYHRRFPAHITVVDAVFDPGRRIRSASRREASTGSVTEGSGSVSPSSIRTALDDLAETLGSVPRVRLPDTQAEADTLAVRPSSSPLPEATGRYQLLGEISRGGMGAVLKGSDPDLGRDVAIKVLLESHRENPQIARRFIEEAQIGGQLQHPGIVPVYELGAFGPNQPYFTMKLVQGRTLAALLTERADPADDRPRFLGIFAQVCQTMAYAHARGVIHRDLKPSNIMVGAFGEVQVMDWGLAKVLPRGGIAEQPQDPTDAAAARVIRTVRSGSDADASRAGSVLGTPAYMAPEQARGAVEGIDERADVFGLGSILCEILTGRPAYRGPSPQVVLRQAMRGDTAEALNGLETCGADAELILLAGACLALAPEQRPRDALEVARRMTAYLTGVQERLRKAELDRVEAQARAEEETKRRALADDLAREAQARAEEEAKGRELADRLAHEAEGRAVEERRRRRITLGLAASILALAGLAGTTWLVAERARAGRRAAVAQVLDEALRLQLVARAAADDAPVRWAEALAAMERAEGLLAQGGQADQLREAAVLKDSITRDRDAARREENWVARLTDIRSARADDDAGSASESGYLAVFREAGIDPDLASPTAVAARIRSFRQALAQTMIVALDDWTDVRMRLRRDRPGATRLHEAATAADPDPWRNRLRAAFSLTEPAQRLAALREFARTARNDELPPISVAHLGNILAQAGDVQAGSDLLRAALRTHPRDVWLNYDLAQWLESLGQTREAIRFYMVARTLRPETAHELAHALEGTGQTDEAIAVFQDLAHLRPQSGRHLYCLGTACQSRGRTREAALAFEGAVAAFRQTIRLQPEDFYAHSLLGLALSEQGKLSEAIAAHREAIQLRHRPQQPRPRPARPGEALRGHRRIPHGDPPPTQRRLVPQLPRPGAARPREG
jgi:serine/threonine-protein kinase